MGRPTCVRVDTSALRHNLAVARRHADGARVMAVVKADAYGHGLVRVARELEAAGVDALGVACLEEGSRLRESGIRAPVYIMEGPFSADELPAIRGQDLGLVLHSPEQVAAVAASDGAEAIPCFLKVDTGMHRLGVAPEAVPGLVTTLRESAAVGFMGLLSHLARADDPADPYNADQIGALHSAAASAPETPLSLANSAALLALPQARLDWVRPGLMLYGASPFPASEGADLGLKPVLALTSEVIAERTLEPGQWLGYGTGFQAPRRLRVGVVPLGYGDGYSRQLGTGTPVRIEGVATRTLGNVCMDMIFVDLDNLPQMGVGAQVELLGPGVPAEVLARAGGTIPYEVLCGLRNRLHRETV